VVLEIRPSVHSQGFPAWLTWIEPLGTLQGASRSFNPFSFSYWLGTGAGDRRLCGPARSEPCWHRSGTSGRFL